MMELKELLMDMRKELRCADKYAKEAIKHRAEYPELSEIYHRIAKDKTTHAEMLAGQARHMAEKHHMGEMWDVEDYMFKHDIGEVKRCLEDYKN
jgi:rubrerythrin